MSNGIGNLPTTTTTSTPAGLPRRIPGASGIPTAPHGSVSMTAAQVAEALANTEPDEPAVLGYGIPAWQTAFGA